MTLRRKGVLTVVSAPSGAGKTTLCRAVEKAVPDLKYSTSYTTRPPRPGEVQGKDYFFVSEAEFKEMVQKDQFAEWAEVHNHFYGTHEGFLKTALESGMDVLLDVDVQGAKLLREKQLDGNFVFVLPPSMEVLKARLQERRSEVPEEVERRIRQAREEIRDAVEYGYLIVNDELEKAVRHLEAIVLAGRLRVQREDQDWVRSQFQQ